MKNYELILVCFVLSFAYQAPVAFALIKKASLIVTNDSGQFHFAVALGILTVSTWGPCRPEHYGPADRIIHKMIYKPVYRSPCLHHADSPPHNGNNICVRNILVSCVLESTRKILEIINNDFDKKRSSSRFSFRTTLIQTPRIEMTEFNPVVTYRDCKASIEIGHFLKLS